MLLLLHDNAGSNLNSMSEFSGVYFHLGNKFQIFSYLGNKF